jgi:hypothetical protein
MAKEDASWVTELNTANPVDGDPVGEGDDHLRMLKTVLKNSFPSTSTAAIVPNMSGQANKYLQTDGTDAQWAEVDTSGLQTDIALLGFKVAANGSLAAYNLKDQTIDDFQDASGIDASASTGEIRNAANYYSGVTVGSYSVDALTNTGTAGSTVTTTWTCPANTSQAEILVVAGGGGGGGRYNAGGGGAGGIVYDADYLVVAGTVYDATIGAGGDGGFIGTDGDNGVDTVWNVNAEGSGLTLTAKGGGGGGGGATSAENAVAGGSGGGGAAYPTQGSGAASNQGSFAGATSYGNSGANAQGGGNPAAGGGGGAGAAGSVGTGSHGGAGGVGVQFSNFDMYGTDSNNDKPTADGSGSGKGYFGGGGGGASEGSSQSPGGAGGGGKGGAYNGGSEITNTTGLVSTGGGGGGVYGTTYQTGDQGGTGIILIRHRTETYNDISLVSNSTTAESTPTKGDIVMTYTNGVGTATVNTDIKAWISRDNGTTYTQATLSSEGTTGGHTILTAHNVDISSQPSGTSMRYKIETLNQSASKETRIQAVSLGWS